MKLEKWIKPYLDELKEQSNWKDSLIQQTRKTDKYYVGMSVYEEIPEPIKSEIQGFENDYMEYHLEIPSPHSGDKCKVFVKIHYPEFQTLTSIYEKIMEKIVSWLKIAIRVKPDMCGKELHLHLFMSTHKKEFVSADTALDKRHVNTAHSTGCIEKSSIGIFREEEWFKVFIHETFHSFGMSFNELHESFLNDVFYNGVYQERIRQDLRLYEVHCELMATIFNSLFKSYWGSDENDNFMKNIKKEQEFSLYQCHKVLQTNAYGNNFSKIMKFDEVVPREKEKTSVFSYYIAKTILLLNIDHFIDFISRQQSEFVVYKWEQNKVQEYIQCIFRGFSKFKREYNRRLPFNENWQIKYAKTMRMTILGGNKNRKHKTIKMRQNRFR